MKLLELKVRALSRCRELVEERVKQQKAELDALQEAANNETKSSAGDKYESTRAMMHLEKEKVAAQLNTNLKLRQILSQVSESPKKEIGLGSMIRTDNGIYFLSTSLGQVQVGDQQVICLSMVSPLGKELDSAQVGDTIRFNTLNLTINEVT